MLIWALLRLPFLLGLAFLLRNPILGFVERAIDIDGVTKYSIVILSTPLSRVASVCVLTLLLYAFWIVISRTLTDFRAYGGMLAASAVLLLILFAVADMNLAFAMPALLVLATNLWPGRGWTSGWRRLMIFAPGVAEFFFLDRFFEWVRSLAGKSPSSGRGVPTGLAACFLAAIAAVCMTNSVWLVRAEQALRMSDEVSLVATGDMNWIDIDANGRYLYASGHGLPHFHRFDLDNLQKPVLKSAVSTGGAQGFVLDEAAQEIFVFNTITKNLLTLDANTLALKNTLAVPDLSPGDPWIAVDRGTNTATMVSEADIQSGSPFIVTDLGNGLPLDRRQLDAGNLLLHPQRPLLYLSFFRNSNRLMAYDLAHREIVREVPTDARVDRMAYWPSRNELLVASPLESRVLRFNADNLLPIGTLPSIFGVRSLAVDDKRGWLLCGSLSTGMLVVNDLHSGKAVRSFYLGPWLRTIVLHPESGTAYVSSNGALYKVSYDNRD